MKAKNKDGAWKIFKEKIKQLNISDRMDEGEYFICLYASFDPIEGLSYYFGKDGEIKIQNIPKRIDEYKGTTFEIIEVTPSVLEIKILGAVFYYYTCYLKEIEFIKVN